MPTSTPNVKESLPEAENKCVNPAVPALLQPKISKNQPKLLSLPVNLPKKGKPDVSGKVGEQASVPKKRKSRNSGWKAAKAGGRNRVQCQASGPKT
jgi:hypothetical protein